MPEIADSIETVYTDVTSLSWLNCLKALGSSAMCFLYRYSDRAVALYQCLKSFTQPLHIWEGAGTDIHKAILMEY